MDDKPILYFYPASPPARAVLTLARAIGLDLDLKLIDIFNGENLTPEYLKLNPLHAVPVLVDNGHILSDSHAINAYLADKYSKTDDLYPKDFVLRSIVNQRLFFDSTVLFAAGKGIVGKIFRKEIPDYPEEALKEISASYLFLEALLAENKYVAGDNLTIADFSCATTVLSKAILQPIEEAATPKVFAWLKRIRELPYFDEVNKKPVEDLKNRLETEIMKNKREK